MLSPNLGNILISILMAWPYLDEHSQDGQPVRLIHGAAQVPVLGVVVDQVELSREGLPVHRVFAAPGVLSAPVGVELSQLVDILLQRSSSQAWSNSLLNITLHHLPVSVFTHLSLQG